MQHAMSCDDTEQHQQDEGNEDSYEANCPILRHCSSVHSSQSSLFNASAAEDILRLFREDAIVHTGPASSSHYDEDDPVV